MTARACRRVVLVHSSDEMYGSDRIVLQIVESMPTAVRERCVVALPRDAAGPGPLARHLAGLGVQVRHRHLPILRRQELKRPLALVVLAWRTLGLARWIRRQRAAVVYSTTSAAVLALPAAGLAGVGRRLAHVQEVWEPREARALSRLVGLADDVIVASRAVRDALPPPLRRRARVVHNGVPTPDRPLPAPAVACRPRYLVASRWTPRKGHRTLLEAWDRAASPGTLVIAGSAPCSGAAVDVSSLVADLAHPESVEVVGQVDSIFDLLDEVDAVIVPSDRPEAFGLVAVEAFSRGRAVIAAAAGGLDEVVADGTNGLTFSPGDVEALARILDQAQPGTLATLGRHGLATYTDHYSAQAFAERMSGVWASIDLVDGTTGAVGAEPDRLMAALA